MSRSLQKLPGEPIILETLHEDYSMAELAAGMSEGQILLASQTQPVIWIADMRRAPIPFIQQFMQMIGGMLQSGKHPMVQQIVYVLPTGMEKTVNLPIFDTIESALRYARSQF